jgi:hypothetical protein
MFAATDTAWAPWYIADTDDKKRGRLTIISHLLSQVPHKPLAPGTSRYPNGSRPKATPSRTCRCGTSRRHSRKPGKAGDQPAAARAAPRRPGRRTAPAAWAQPSVGDAGMSRGGPERIEENRNVFGFSLSAE